MFEISRVGADRVWKLSKYHGSGQEALKISRVGSGRVGSGRVGSGRVGSGHPSFLLNGVAFYEVGLGESSTYLQLLMAWLVYDSFHVDWAFCFDRFTVAMPIIVATSISTLLHFIYSTG